VHAMQRSQDTQLEGPALAAACVTASSLSDSPGSKRPQDWLTSHALVARLGEDALHFSSSPSGGVWLVAIGTAAIHSRHAIGVALEPVEYRRPNIALSVTGPKPVNERLPRLSTESHLRRLGAELCHRRNSAPLRQPGGMQ